VFFLLVGKGGNKNALTRDRHKSRYLVIATIRVRAIATISGKGQAKTICIIIVAITTIPLTLIIPLPIARILPQTSITSITAISTVSASLGSQNIRGGVTIAVILGISLRWVVTRVSIVPLVGIVGARAITRTRIEA